MIKGTIDNTPILKVYSVGLTIGFFVGLVFGYAIWGLR